jgi:NIMA (never in mitosis gene a)-related kinase
MGGGLNGGISKVKCDNPKARGMVFIEKRFSKDDMFERDIPRREIQILYQVQDHDHITKMVDHFLDERVPDGAVYLEYCAVGNLVDVADEVAKGAHVHEHKMWHWFHQLACALAYCHRGPVPDMTDDEVFQSGWSRVYHRDIKPANILLTVEDGEVVTKLADFGLAVTEDYLAIEGNRERAITQPGGTPGFDAPEFPFFTGASDIWQLGLSILCACNGIRTPWSRAMPQGQLWDKERPAGPKYSVDLSEVLRTCLKKGVQKRVRAFPLRVLIETKYLAIQSNLPVDKTPTKVFDAIDVGHSNGMPPAGYRRPNYHFSMYHGPAHPGHAGNHGNPQGGFHPGMMPFYTAGFWGDDESR